MCVTEGSDTDQVQSDSDGTIAAILLQLHTAVAPGDFF